MNPSRRTKDEVKERLAAAKVRLNADGVRPSEARMRALELLLEQRGAVRVYDLLDRFKAGGLTAPVIIYRALDALVRTGVAHRIGSLNAYVARERPEEVDPACFIVCDSCGAMAEIRALPSSRFIDLWRGASFEVAAVEAHGRCSSCAA